MECYRFAEDEESRATYDHIRNLNGGHDPELDIRNLRALNSFHQLHTARTREFPGAWRTAFETIDIYVDDYAEARYFLKAWDLLYSTISDVLHRRAIEESQKENRQRRTHKPLKIYN